ncbi:hypothetical protein HDZ31DRAFT_43466 [Schizophyllum fasciatum]
MRGLAVHTVGSIPDLRHFWTTVRTSVGPFFLLHSDDRALKNASSHVVRDVQGHDAIIRVVAVGQEGREQLRIWRKLATAPHALVSANHALPLLRELDLGHITFGVLPRVAQPVAGMYGGWAKNSVGDILDAVLQALEGLAYIHSLGIAHRDAFTYNFLLSWHPESLLAGAAAISKPRVYLIDFEVAVEFAAGVAPADRLCVGPPCIGSLSDPASYAAPRIPEMEHGAPYDPFKLDVWQLGTSLSNFDSTLPRVQDVLRSMASLDPAERLTADGALSLLRGALEDVPPRALHIAPVVHHGPGYVSSAELRAACVALPEAACVARPDDGVEVPDDGVEVPDGGVEVRTS